MPQDLTDDWFRQWLGAVRQQAITWTSVDQDLQRHMASLGPNELKNKNVFWSCQGDSQVWTLHIIYTNICKI